MSDLESKLETYRPTAGRARARQKQIELFGGCRRTELRWDPKGRTTAIEIRVIEKNGTLGPRNLWVRIDSEHHQQGPLFERVEGEGTTDGAV